MPVFVCEAVYHGWRPVHGSQSPNTLTALVEAVVRARESDEGDFCKRRQDRYQLQCDEERLRLYPVRRDEGFESDTDSLGSDESFCGRQDIKVIRDHVLRLDKLIHDDVTSATFCSTPDSASVSSNEAESDEDALRNRRLENLQQDYQVVGNPGNCCDTFPMSDIFFCHVVPSLPRVVVVVAKSSCDSHVQAHVFECLSEESARNLYSHYHENSNKFKLDRLRISKRSERGINAVFAATVSNNVSSHSVDKSVIKSDKFKGSNVKVIEIRDVYHDFNPWVQQLVNQNDVTCIEIDSGPSSMMSNISDLSEFSSIISVVSDCSRRTSTSSVTEEMPRRISDCPITSLCKSTFPLNIPNKIVDSPVDDTDGATMVTSVSSAKVDIESVKSVPSSPNLQLTRLIERGSDIPQSCEKTLGGTSGRNIVFIESTEISNNTIIPSVIPPKVIPCAAKCPMKTDTEIQNQWEQCEESETTLSTSNARHYDSSDVRHFLFNLGGNNSPDIRTIFENESTIINEDDKGLRQRQHPYEMSVLERLADPQPNLPFSSNPSKCNQQLENTTVGVKKKFDEETDICIGRSRKDIHEDLPASSTKEILRYGQDPKVCAETRMSRPTRDQSRGRQRHTKGPAPLPPPRRHPNNPSLLLVPTKSGAETNPHFYPKESHNIRGSNKLVCLDMSRYQSLWNHPSHDYNNNHPHHFGYFSSNGTTWFGAHEYHAVRVREPQSLTPDMRRRSRSKSPARRPTSQRYMEAVSSFNISQKLKDLSEAVFSNKRVANTSKIGCSVGDAAVAKVSSGASESGELKPVIRRPVKKVDGNSTENRRVTFNAYATVQVMEV